MRIKLVILVAAALMIAIGCSHIPSKPGDIKSNLENRVNNHWAAKSALDWRAAYDGFCNEYRNQISFPDFMKMNKIAIKKFKVANIKEDPAGNRADVAMVFSADVQGYPLSDIEITEVWVYENGNWYACPASRGFKTLFE